LGAVYPQSQVEIHGAMPGGWRRALRSAGAYWEWIERFIVFHGKQHPKEMGEPEMLVFLTISGTKPPA